MTDKNEMDRVALTFDLPHAPEKVWRALTDPELLARWLMKTDLIPKVGHRFQFQSEPIPDWNGVVDCEILEVEELRFLSYAWHALGVETVVNWTLEETPTGTLLKLEQTGFKKDQQQSIKGAHWGWTRMAGEALPKVLAEID